MTIFLNSEQERILADAVKNGFARNSDEALDKALDSLRGRQPARPSENVPEDSVAAAARRLANFGKRHNLSLGGISVKDLLNESRP